MKKYNSANKKVARVQTKDTLESQLRGGTEKKGLVDSGRRMRTDKDSIINVQPKSNQVRVNHLYVCIKNLNKQSNCVCVVWKKKFTHQR